MGEIEKVLKAVCQGYRTRTEIAKAAGLTELATGTYLTRLKGRNKITAVKQPAKRKGRGQLPLHYYPRDMGCLLADFWK